MSTPKSNFKKIALIAARAGDSKKAEPVVVLDLVGRSPLADYAVLMRVESAPQLEAVEEEVLIKLKHEGVYCLHKDGMRSRNWKVLDYGGVLVHVYDAHAAGFYAIDKVYEGAKPVEWQEKAAAPAVPAAPAKAPVKKTAAKPVKKAAAKKAPARKAAAKPAKKAAKKPAGKPVKKAAKKVVKKAAKKPAKKTSKKK